eukprot:scaffold1247_cov170-Ochromonas_danica.AAC.11
MPNDEKPREVVGDLQWSSRHRQHDPSESFFIPSQKSLQAPLYLWQQKRASQRNAITYARQVNLRREWRECTEQAS